jgi:hypothetical protein
LETGNFRKNTIKQQYRSFSPNISLLQSLSQL